MHLVMLTYSVFCYCDLDLEPMTLTYELCLGILKMHLHTKNEVCRSRLSKVRAQTDRQTHRQMQLKVVPSALRVVKINTIYTNRNTNQTKHSEMGPETKPNPDQHPTLMWTQRLGVIVQG